MVKLQCARCLLVINKRWQVMTQKMTATEQVEASSSSLLSLMTRGFDGSVEDMTWQDMTCLRSGPLFLLLEESEEWDVGDFNDLETDAWDGMKKVRRSKVKEVHSLTKSTVTQNTFKIRHLNSTVPRARERMSERCERSEQRGASEWVRGASERASGP